MGWTIVDSTAYHYYPSNAPGTIDWSWAEAHSRSDGSIAVWYDPNLLYDKLVTHTLSGEMVVKQKWDALYNIDLHERYMPNNTIVKEISEQRTFSGKNVTEYILKQTSAQQIPGSSGIDQRKNTYIYTGNRLQSVKQSFFNENTKKWEPKDPGETKYYYNPADNLAKTEAIYSKGMVVNQFYAYDASNRLVKEWFIQSKSPTILLQDTTLLKIYTYNLAGDVETEEHWTQNGTDLSRYFKYSNTFDAKHNKQEQLVYEGDANGWNLFGKRTFLYNAWDVIIGLEFTRWDGTKWTDMAAQNNQRFRSSHKLTFEYELTAPNNVDKLEKQKQDVAVYPLPSSDFINIINDWETAQPFTAAICDMHGKVLRQWQEQATIQYRKSISVNDLPAGVYLLKMYNGNEQVSSRFTIAR